MPSAYKAHMRSSKPWRAKINISFNFLWKFCPGFHRFFGWPDGNGYISSRL